MALQGTDIFYVTRPGVGSFQATYQDIQIAGADFLPGHTTIFYQNAAPTGFVRLTGFDQSQIRITTAGGGTGGSLNYTQFYSNLFTASVNGVISGGIVGPATLSEGQIQSHSHGLSPPSLGGGGAAASGPTGARGYDPAPTSGSTGGGGAHTHTGPTGATVVTYTLDFQVQYLDAIVCQYV